MHVFWVFSWVLMSQTVKKSARDRRDIGVTCQQRASQFRGRTRPDQSEAPTLPAGENLSRCVYGLEDFWRRAHRARTARRAPSLRSSGVSLFALILPPLLPQAAKRRRTSSGSLPIREFYVAGRHSVNDMIDYT
jgi:hypothetical protein